MSISDRYVVLGRSLSKLEKHHLGFAPRLAGGYTERQLSQAAAYTIFVHGEFESFLEEWALEILDAIAARGFGSNFSPMLGHLMAYRSALGVPTQVPKNNAWQIEAGSSVAAHRRIILNNHGISERHICTLFIPLGIDIVTINSLMISDLNAFSKIRGDHAHQSRGRHLGQQFDPFDRLAKANNIYTILKTFDEEMQEHKKAC